MSKKSKTAKHPSGRPVATPNQIDPRQTVGESLAKLSAEEIRELEERVSRYVNISDEARAAQNQIVLEGSRPLPPINPSYFSTTPLTVENIARAVVDELELRGYLPSRREEAE